MEILGSAPAFGTPEIQRPDRACDCGQWNWKLLSGIVRAAPAINEAVEALTGCEGMTTVIFATCYVVCRIIGQSLSRSYLGVSSPLDIEPITPDSVKST